MKVLAAGLLLLAEWTVAVAGLPDPCDSIILESKTIFPGQAHDIGSDTAAYLYVRVWITNKDTLSNVTLPLEERSVSGGAYAIIARPRTFGSTVNRLTSKLPCNLAAIYTRYNSESPDSFTLAAFFCATDPYGTAELPSCIRKPFWEIKFDSVLPNLGMVELDSIRIQEIGPQFVDLVGRQIEVNFVKSIITVAAPKGDLNLDFSLTPSDVVFMLLTVFQGTSPPAGLAACDLDCDAEPTPADVVILLNMVFREESPPC